MAQYHIGLEEGQAGRFCILPGDPGRCASIAALFDDPHPVMQNREYNTIAGMLDGVPVSVTSTGIGGPSAAIAMEELYAVGVRTFIRVGTCGGIALPVRAGDLVVATGAVRAEGTSREYAPIEFPAVADFDVACALRAEAQAMGKTCHMGVVQCKDSFYGQHDPGRMPVAGELLANWEAWKRLGVLSSEMESAALFTVAAALGVRCGTVLACVWNQERKAAGLPVEECHDTSFAARCAVGAIRRLIAAEKE